MYLKLLALLAFFIVSLDSYGQYTHEYDTLNLQSSALGTIDSIDYRSGIHPTSFVGGNSILNADGFSIHRFSNDYGGFRFQDNIVFQTMRFSGLPYLGFAYSFGAQGTQFVRANYTQAFTDSLVLNIDYLGGLGNGYLRRSAYRTSDVKAQLEWKSSWYTLQFRGAYLGDSVEQSGGVTTYTLIETQGLDFSPIAKPDAASANKYGLLQLNNYFHFNPKGKSRLGLIAKHQYDIRNRAYHESDDLNSIYDTLYIDTLTTYDRSNLARLRNEAGFFLTKGTNYIDARLGHTYWKFLNLGNDFDTTEIDLRSNLRWRIGRFQLTNEFSLNIIGGFNAITDDVCATIEQKRWWASGSLSFANQAPDPIKRAYVSNTYQYSQASISTEQRLRIRANAGYRFKNDTNQVQAFADYVLITNAYLFNDSLWEQSSDVIGALQIGVQGKFQFGKFHLHPKVIVSQQSQGLLPAVQGYTRFYFKSTIFKAKRLLLLFGVDLSYTSKFNHRHYLPAMDAYRWDQPLGESTFVTNAHAFAAMEVSTFRFFVRYENIGYFWNDKLISESEGYPLSSQRLRIGITWDFFN